MKRNPVTGRIIPKPTAYLLHDLDPAIWDRFKQRADASGLPMRTVMLELVAAYANGAIEVEQQLVVRPRKAGVR